MMKIVMKSESASRTWLGGDCIVPIACRRNPSTMMIRVKAVIVSRIPGASVRTVIRPSTRSAPTQSPSPPPSLTSTLGSSNGLTGPPGGASGGAGSGPSTDAAEGAVVTGDGTTMGSTGCTGCAIATPAKPKSVRAATSAAKYADARFITRPATGESCAECRWRAAPRASQGQAGARGAPRSWGPSSAWARGRSPRAQGPSAARPRA